MVIMFMSNPLRPVRKGILRGRPEKNRTCLRETPREFEDYSLNDAFDVAQYRLSKLEKNNMDLIILTVDLPIFIICAMQKGAKWVSAEDLNVFYRVQELWFAGKFAGRRIRN